jgi:hypothetical protein
MKDDKPTREFRPGYYVNDVWYGERIAQARARARHLANELPGPMEVIHQSEDGELRIVSTHLPNNQDTIETPPRVYNPAAEGDNAKGGFERLVKRATDE